MDHPNVSFGDALQGLGFSLRYNDTGSSSNCVFVTLARLLNTTANTVIRSSGAQPHPDGSFFVSPYDLGVLGFRTRSMVAWKRGSTPPRRLEASRPHTQYEEVFREHGIVYIRWDGTGHAVVRRRNRDDRFGEWECIDYQGYMPNDVTNEVRRSEIVMVFWAMHDDRTNEHSGWMDMSEMPF